MYVEFIFTMRRYASAVYAVAWVSVVLPSVYLFVTSQWSTKMAKRKFEKHHYDNQGTPVLLAPTISVKFN